MNHRGQRTCEAPAKYLLDLCEEGDRNSPGTRQVLFEGVRDSRHPPPALRGPLSRLRRCTRVAFGCGPRFSSPFPRLGVAMVRSRRVLYFAPGSRRIRPVRPKLVSQVVHRPAPARARELGTATRANGLSPWPAWLRGPMGRYGPLWAAMGPNGPLWAAMGRYGPLWSARCNCWPPRAALGRSGPLWPALGCSAQLSAALGRWGHCVPLGNFGVSRALVAAPGRRVR